MPRRPREEEAGAVHHVCARGAKRALIYWDEHDHLTYLRTLARVVELTGWRCLGYCLMVNHVHLVVETPEPNLGVGMHRLHGEFARRFNERHGTSGHVFDGRYRSKRVRSDAQMWQVARYVAQNPVEAKLAPRPDQWRWSSYAATAGRDGVVVPAWLDVERVLFYFGSAGGDPADRFVEFCGS